MLTEPSALAPGRFSVSVVIPTLAEETAIAGAVRNALAAGADEVVVADGGSLDRTAELARAAGARTLQAPRGRGLQLNAGAAAAAGDVLCFLHADVRLPPEGIDSIREALSDSRVAGGNFRIRFGETLHARFLAAFCHVIRRLGMY
jgi:glycosyltransferase involved in cell wall biosynthesis